MNLVSDGHVAGQHTRKRIAMVDHMFRSDEVGKSTVQGLRA